MNYVEVDNIEAINGLDKMLRALDGKLRFSVGAIKVMPVATAMLVVAVAKRVEDRPEWFPRGRWATVQALELRIEKELATLFKEAAE